LQELSLRRQLERAAQDAVEHAHAAMRPGLEQHAAALRAAEADVAELRAALAGRDAALSELSAALEDARRAAADAGGGRGGAGQEAQQQHREQADASPLVSASGGSIASSPALQALRSGRPPGPRGLFGVYFVAVHAVLLALNNSRASVGAGCSANGAGGGRVGDLTQRAGSSLGGGSSCGARARLSGAFEAAAATGPLLEPHEVAGGSSDSGWAHAGVSALAGGCASGAHDDIMQ
jgi:hypothetical protein